MIRPIYLLDGPLMTAPERRAAIVERMARLLREACAYACGSDARRVLYRDGYRTLEIELCVDDARQLAAQDQVAKEMAGS